MAVRNLTDGAAFKQLIVPQSIAGDGAAHEGASRIKGGDGETVTFLVEVGAMDAASTLDFKVIQADAATAGNTKDVTSAALTQVAAASGASKVYAVEVRCDAALDSANGYKWLGISYTVTNAKNVLLSVLAVNFLMRRLPATNGLTQAVKVLV